MKPLGEWHAARGSSARVTMTIKVPEGTMATDQRQPGEQAVTEPQSKPPLLPPDERFWQRYSPNHELPVSSATSAAIHLLVLGILALGASTFASSNPPVSVDSIEVGGGSGGGVSEGDEAGTRNRSTRHEDVQGIQDSAALRRKSKAPESLHDVPRVSKESSRDPDDRRLFNEDVKMGEQLSVLGAQVRDRLNALQAKAARGSQGPGDGGAPGRGVGPGKGDGRGSGGTLSPRPERQKRWTMIFNIRDPEDYARQLQALGAILAAEAGNGEYFVIEDLSQRPAVAKRRDVSKIDRMFWVDDKPEVVEPLFRVLQYQPAPKYFVAFFPQELERELLRKELAHKNLPEDRIAETRFQIRRTATGYEAVVTEQRSK
jgi:hypothetical protein